MRSASCSGFALRVIGLRALREEKAALHHDPQVAAQDRADLSALERR